MEDKARDVEEVDLRSDTVTQPSTAMREVMAKAIVGDDVYREDPTVLDLEKTVSKMLGKEAGLFVPSGTMGNLICIMVHSWRRGTELLLGDKSHIHLHEQGGVSQLGSIHTRTLTNADDGTFCLKELEAKIRKKNDCHSPITSVVAIENTHNMCGGKPLPIPWMHKCRQICKKYGLALHCDGARLFNAAIWANVDPLVLAEPVDSLSVCLSKGLGAPVGSVIVGSNTFIEKAIRLRKVLGGGMRQVGILAAAGLYAIEHNIQRLSVDHQHARQLIREVKAIGGKLFRSDDEKGISNIVIINIEDNSVSPQDVVERLSQISSDEVDALGFAVSVRCIVISTSLSQFRLTFHLNIDSEKAFRAIQKIKYVFKEISCKISAELTEYSKTF